MGELIWAILALLSHLAWLATILLALYGFVAGRLVWLSKDEAMVRTLRRRSSP